MAERSRFGLHMGNTTITLSTLKVKKKILHHLFIQRNLLRIDENVNYFCYRKKRLKLLRVNLVIDLRMHVLQPAHRRVNFVLDYLQNKALHAMEHSQL